MTTVFVIVIIVVVHSNSSFNCFVPETQNSTSKIFHHEVAFLFCFLFLHLCDLYKEIYKDKLFPHCAKKITENREPTVHFTTLASFFTRSFENEFLFEICDYWRFKLIQVGFHCDVLKCRVFPFKIVERSHLNQFYYYYSSRNIP